MSLEQQEHRKDCVWGQSDCEYKNTHHYCPHKEHKSLECECFAEKHEVIAVVEERRSAIDHTPIIRFRACKTIEAGTLFEWDQSENKLITV